jgi:hypothetical protein
MTQEIVARLFELVMLSVAGAGFASIMAAGVYDLQAVARRQRIGATVRSLRKKSAQPPVTVVVYTDNDAETVTACLESVSRSLYRNYDLVVVDNASRDGTKRAVRRFMRKHPQLTLRFYAKRKHSPLQEALRQAYQKSRKGELVVTLAASSRPSRSFLEMAVARFAAEPDLMGLSANEFVDTPLTVIDLVPEVARLVRHVVMKSLSLLRARRGTVDLDGVYRSALLVSGGRANVRYEGTLPLLVVARGLHRGATTRRRLTLMMLAATTVLLMSYAMVMAASLVSYIPLFLSWSLVTVASLAATWSDEGISLMQKLQLTLAATLIYFLLYVALLSFLLEQGVKSARSLPKAVRPRPIWHMSQRTIS